MNGNSIAAEKNPMKDEVETWKSIWQTPDKPFNKNFSWLHKLELNNCSRVQPKEYEITKDILKTSVKFLDLRKSLGRDIKSDSRLG